MTDEAFTPHGIIITERSRPTQVHSAGWVGISKLLRLNFDLTKGEDTFVQQAIDGLAERIIKYDCEDWRGQIPWFGPAIYIVINYSTSKSIRYDLAGNVIEHLDGVVETGYGAETIHLAKGHLAAKLRRPNAIHN